MRLKIFLKMASNLVENLKQLITQLITDLITATLQVLETSGDVTNSFNALAENLTQFEPQLLQILEENGIETEALVNVFNTARSLSSSDTGIQESMDNLRQQVEEIFTDARIQELAEELKETLGIYYGEILNESLRVNSPDFFEFLYSPLSLASLLQSDPEFKAELVRFLTKFLEVEAALNDQQN